MLFISSRLQWGNCYTLFSHWSLPKWVVLARHVHNPCRWRIVCRVYLSEVALSLIGPMHRQTNADNCGMKGWLTVFECTKCTSEGVVTDYCRVDWLYSLSIRKTFYDIMNQSMWMTQVCVTCFSSYGYGPQWITFTKTAPSHYLNQCWLIIIKV